MQFKGLILPSARCCLGQQKLQLNLRGNLNLPQPEPTPSSSSSFVSFVRQAVDVPACQDPFAPPDLAPWLDFGSPSQHKAAGASTGPPGE